MASSLAKASSPFRRCPEPTRRPRYPKRDRGRRQPHAMDRRRQPDRHPSTNRGEALLPRPRGTRQLIAPKSKSQRPEKVSTSIFSNGAKSSGLFVRIRANPCALIVATMFASWMRLPLYFVCGRQQNVRVNEAAFIVRHRHKWIRASSRFGCCLCRPDLNARSGERLAMRPGATSAPHH